MVTFASGLDPRARRLRLGRYAYSVDGTHQDVTEIFRRFEVEGVEITESIRRAPDAGVTLTAIQERRDGVFLRAEFGLLGMGPAGMRQALASWDREGDRLRVRRLVEGTEEREERAWPDGAVVLPLMRCFLGEVLQAIEGDQDGTVLVPWIQDPADDRVFLFQESPRRSWRDSEEPSLAPGITAWRCQGGGYTAESARFLVDETGLLVHYRQTQPWGATWTCDLVEYEERPDPDGTG